MYDDNVLAKKKNECESYEFRANARKTHETVIEFWMDFKSIFTIWTASNCETKVTRHLNRERTTNRVIKTNGAKCFIVIIIRTHRESNFPNFIHQDTKIYWKSYTQTQTKLCLTTKKSYSLVCFVCVLDFFLSYHCHSYSHSSMLVAPQVSAGYHFQTIQFYHFSSKFNSNVITNSQVNRTLICTQEKLFFYLFVF